MQNNQNQGGMRRPTRMPDANESSAPRYRSSRDAQQNAENGRPLDSSRLYDDFDTYYHPLGRKSVPQKKRHVFLWTIVFLMTMAF